MNATVAKWGNSLGLRIPNGLARTLQLEERSQVTLLVEDGALVVRPVVPRKQFDLDLLLADITDENIHAEFNTGGTSLGNEF